MAERPATELRGTKQTQHTADPHPRLEKGELVGAIVSARHGGSGRDNPLCRYPVSWCEEQMNILVSYFPPKYQVPL